MMKIVSYEPKYIEDSFYTENEQGEIRELEVVCVFLPANKKNINLAKIYGVKDSVHEIELLKEEMDILNISFLDRLLANK